MKMILFILFLLFTSSSSELINLSATLDYCEGGANPSHEPGKGKHC
ncbi:hypothetical protein Pfo_025762 [Paulownia fortunei]|nr:hypothetical protein Pfo_025762 [Paulownia fortunei]